MKKNQNSTRQNFETGALVLVISAVIVKIIGAFFKIPLSNLLGDAGCGQFSSAYDIFMPFYAMAMSGMPVALSRLISDAACDGRYREISVLKEISRRLFIKIGLVAFICFALLIPVIGKIIGDFEHAVYGLCAVAPSILLFFIMSYYRGVYEGLESMTPTAISDLIEALCKLFLGYGFAYFTLKLTQNTAFAAAMALFGITIGVAGATVYLAVKYKKHGNFPTLQQIEDSPEAPDKKVIKKNLILVLLPITLSAVLVSVFAQLIDTLTVRACLSNAGFPDTAALYGVRSKAFTLYNLVPSITIAVGVSAVPELSAAHGRRQLKTRLETMLKLTAFIALPAGMGMSFAARPIMTLLYKSASSEGIGAQMLQIYGIAAIFVGFSIPIINALQAIKQSKKAFLILIVAAVCKTVLNIVLVSDKKIGVLGAAYSTLSAGIIITVLGLILLKHSIKELSVLSPVLKPVLSSLVIVFALFIPSGKSMLTVAAIVVLVIAYIVLIFATKTFSAEEIEHLPFGKKLKNVLKMS